MDKIRSIARDQKNHSASTQKRFKNGCTGPWSDLNHDVLYSVMMQLGVIDFVAFSGVCQSWRSLALSNRIEFMASKPPMSIRITNRPYEKHCFLEDFEGKKTSAEYAVFLSNCKSSAAVKPSLWADPWSGIFAGTPSSGFTWLLRKDFSRKDMWYFPHDCFNVNRLEVS